MRAAEHKWERPGRCSRCQRAYADKVFNIEAFIRNNRGKVKGTPGGFVGLVGEVKAREHHARYLVERGYVECDRPNCEKALKLAGEGES